MADTPRKLNPSPGVRARARRPASGTVEGDPLVDPVNPIDPNNPTPAPPPPPAPVPLPPTPPLPINPVSPLANGLRSTEFWVSAVSLVSALLVMFLGRDWGLQQHVQDIATIAVVVVPTVYTVARAVLKALNGQSQAKAAAVALTETTETRKALLAYAQGVPDKALREAVVRQAVGLSVGVQR